MPTLSRMIETLKEPDVGDGMRLFLSTNESTSFPVKILQDGIKVTIESNSDLKNMMLGNLLNIDDEEVSECVKGHEFKKLMFSLTLFHSVLLERVRYGAIGWVNPYKFLKEDFSVSLKQLKNILNEYERTN